MNEREATSPGEGSDVAPVSTECSRAGCRADAAWNVNWRNPALHTTDRVKVWRACDDHRAFLSDYLSSRGFPVVVTTLSEVPARVPDTTSEAAQ